MTSKRFNQVKDIYESTIIQEAASVDPNEWLNKLLEEKSKGKITPEVEEKQEPEEEKEEEYKEPEPPELPGQLKEVQYPEQVPMFPGGDRDLPFRKIYAPSFALFSECPTCKTKIDPIDLPKGGRQYLYRKECPRCKQLYNKMRMLVEEKGLSPDEAINAASTPRFNRNTMKVIWETQGSTDVIDAPLQKDVTPSIRRKVEDALRFRLNVKKDKEGKIIYGPQGFPIPEFPPKYVTTADLAKKLRWHPDNLVEFLESKGFAPIPLGGMGRVEVPSNSPLEKDQSENERRLRALQLMLKRIKNPQSIISDLQEELQHLLTEYSKLRAPGGPGGPALKPGVYNENELPPEIREERMNEIKRNVLTIKQKIQNVTQESQKGASEEVQQQIENEIKRLEPIVESEKAQGKERFKTSWYNVWNMDAIKDAIKERQEELEKVILPMEKAMYIGRKARYFEDLTQKLNTLQERLKKEKEQLKTNLEPTERKAFQLLFQYRAAADVEKKALSDRVQKVMGFDAKMLEKSYGRDLDKYLKLQQMKNKQIEKAEEKEIQAKEYAENYAAKFIEFTTSMGYTWNDPEGNEVLNKNKLLSEIEAFVDEHTEETPKSEASVNYIIEKQGAEQISLWDEPKEEEEDKPAGGTQFFGTAPKPIEKEPEKITPEIEKVPQEAPVKKPDKTAWKFGVVKGVYNYNITGKTPEGQELRYSGKIQFTPGHEFENVEKVLENKLSQLATKHGLLDNEGSRFKITVKSPKKRTQSYTFHIQDGKPMWHGTRLVKTQLMEQNPEIKALWRQGLLPIENIVEFNGKLYDIHDLGKPSGRPTIPTKKNIWEPKSEKAKAMTRLKEIEQQLQDSTLLPEEKEKLKEEQQTLLKIMERKPKKRKLPGENEEDEEEGQQEVEKSLYYTPKSPSSKLEMEETKKCPYEGCDATIPKNSVSCWKCKSRIDTKNTRHKVVKTTIPMTREVEVIDPITKQKSMETKRFFVPRFSLITIGLDAEGKPTSAMCEEIASVQRPTTGKKAPAIPDVWKEAEDLLKTLLEDPKVPEEKKEKLRPKINSIYEWLVKNKKEEGEINNKVNPWTLGLPAVGAPTKPCKKCPEKVFGPFNKEKLSNICPDIAQAIKSLDNPMSNVWDYKQVRLITEKEREKDLEKQHRMESKPWYMADDKKASRFDKIISLSKID